MLTPAEELGLSGMNLAARVRKAFYEIPESRIVELAECVRQESIRRQLMYLRDGTAEPIHVMLAPVTVLPDQIAYVHLVSQTIQNALKRLPDFYLADSQVRDVLRLSPGEEAWLRALWGPAQRENNPVFGRYDAVMDPVSPMWKETLKFVEPNMGSIGGLHLVPTAERILADVVLPEVRAHDSLLQLELGQDIRDLLMQDVLDHLEGIGRQARSICLIEPKYAGSGPVEQDALARYYREHFGLTILHADPAELSLNGAEVCYEGQSIDLAYRDYSVADLLELERGGTDIRPVQRLFEQNRVVSSIAAELDQKSCWEVLTDPEIACRYFSAEDRQVFRRHILWTRLLAERRTMLPGGEVGSLLEYVHREHESLVLKPNRAYGGQGVLIGQAVSVQEWAAAIERALQDEQRWVVQKLTSIPVSEFPLVGPDGRVHMEPFHVVLGFAPSRYGVAILGRASQKQVVNVAQRGGMCAVVVGRPPGRLIGPGHWPRGD